MSQGENSSDEEALQRLTSIIVQKISEGAQKTESIFLSACIYRVPEELRKLKESAYSPRLITIGPLHREDKHLQTPLQHVKMSYTNHLLSRLTIGMEDLELAKQKKFTVVQECLAEMKKLVNDAKKCYAEEVTLDEEMMLVDGCFILEFLYRYQYRNLTLVPGRSDPIFHNDLTFCKVQKDLVLFENQIPFFVLEKLFPLIVGRIPDCPDNNLSLTDYVRSCNGKLIMRPLRNSMNSGSAKSTCPSDCVLRVFGCTTAPPEEVHQSGNINDHRTAKYYHHILHILHNLHDGCLANVQTNPEDFDLREMPSASELVRAGVKFVPDRGNDLFKFKFSEPKGLFRGCQRARFKIPPLVIDDHTESYLRNLIALEQCCPGVSRHVSSYAQVMDTLVDNEKDIQVLENAGVLRNHLGSPEDATNLFTTYARKSFLENTSMTRAAKPPSIARVFGPRIWRT